MDPEIDAMSRIAGALSPLEPDAVRRVLRWAIERFQPRDAGAQMASEPAPSAAAGSSAAGLAISGQGSDRTFLSFSDLFDASNPPTGLDKVLVAAFWFQIVQSQEDWDSQRLNTELKHLGHPSSNITRDLASLINRSPRLVLQVRKEGNSQQSRKRYKLTREGVRAVEQLLRASDPLVQT